MSQGGETQPTALDSKAPDALRALATFLALLALMLSALQLLPSHWKLDPTQRRMEEVKAILPEIIGRPEKQIYIFGASAAFKVVPSVVDGVLNPDGSTQYVSYNFADLGRSFRAFLMFAKYLEREVESRGEKTFLTLISMPMAHLTKARRTSFEVDGIRAIENSELFNACLFLDFDDVTDQFSARQTLAIYARKLLFDCGSPVYLKTQINSAFRRFWSNADGTDLYLLMISNLPQWDPRTRGAEGHVTEGPLSAWVEASQRQYQAPVHYEAKRDFRVACCDIENLDLEEQAVADYFESIRILRGVSEHMLFFEMPYNREYVRRTTQGQANRDALVGSVIEKAEIEFIDFSAQMSTADFADVTHLVPSSARAFSRTFGEAIRQRIEKFGD